MLRILLFLAAFVMPAQGEEVVAGLSQTQISISTNFDGSEILIFGAVKREDLIDTESELGVIITVSGPDQALTVRRKEKLAAIWVNRDSLDVRSAPSFYSVATTAPLNDLLSDVADKIYLVSVPRAIYSGFASQGVVSKGNFIDALIRIRRSQDLYQLNEGSINLVGDTLFNTSIALPANLVEGNYKVRFFLTRNEQVINEHQTVIFVQKVGMERFLFNLAYEQPILYGLLSLFIAIAAGWGASAVFRYIRG